jgi:hypothetical protein
MAIEGWLEYVSERSVSGWAFDPQAPEAHPTVSLRLGNRLIGEAKCSLFRPDLRAAKGGKGDYGFICSFAVPIETRDLGEVSAVVAGETLPILTISSANAQPALKFMTPLTECSREQESSPSGTASYPVFVLGSVRTGTSALGTAIASGTRYVGFGEGHFFDLMYHLQHCVETFYAEKQENLQFNTVMIRHVPQDFYEDLLHSTFRSVARQVFPSPYWIDKTPNRYMIELAPTLRRVWPMAKFIFMKRRGIENLLSRLHHFPDSISFATHCSDWATSMEAWNTTRPALGASAIEIDQREMLHQPSIVARRVGNFLELDDSEIESLRTQLGSGAGSSAERTLELSETGWSSEQIAIFKNVCGATMRKFGYSIGKSYFEGQSHPQAG